MVYKVFLVEDEAAAREGIRENVDWQAAGFEYCGEAPDGDIALPLIEKTQPDLLITDIKMPFMDGLQLSKIIRENMPWVKIIILSGHDEFEYAQLAVRLGVSEYILKPVTAVKLHDILIRMSSLLDQERDKRDQLKQLKNKLHNNLALQRERLLFQLVVGGVSSTEAIDQCQQLGLDIIAPFYLVVLFKVIPHVSAEPFHYDDYQQIQTIVTDLIYPHSGTFLTQKSAEDLLLIMTSESLEELHEDGTFLAGLVQEEIENALPCTVTIGMGTPQQRLAEISHSFSEAYTVVKQASVGVTMGDLNNGSSPLETLKLEQTAVEHYLKSGTDNEFDTFYETHLKSIVNASIHSFLVKHYLFVNIVLVAAEFIDELGGDAEQIIPEINHIEDLLTDAKTVVQIKETIRKVFTQAHTCRNNHTSRERNRNMHQVKTFIDMHFANPDLMLKEVAAKANLSPSYFSAVFSQEFGESYKDYITRLRIARAKELLLTTNLKCAEIAYQSGYNDPHYFSHVFRKNIGIPPQQFRQKLDLS